MSYFIVMFNKMIMSLMYEYGQMMKKMNGKFTFGVLNVVLSVDGGMGRYSYIAQGMAWGYSR